MRVRYVFISMLTLLAACSVVQAQQPPGQTVTINYFSRFVIDGGLLTWFVLIPLSMATFALILEYALTLRTSRIVNLPAHKELSQAMSRGDVAGAWKMLAGGSNFLKAVTKRGLVELPNSYESAEYAVIEATEEQATRLHRKLEYLNIIGTVAPMIGLFGTVYGIILAFNKLVEVVREGGVTQPDQLAEGISVALVTTFWGLIVAIPALAMYGFFRNRIDALAAQVATLAMDVVRAVKPEQMSALKALVEPEE